MALFEKAAKLKLRFNTQRGQVMAEDLFDLPLSEIDDLAKELNKDIQGSKEESFVVKKSKPSEVLELQFGIVKRVITIRLEDIEKAETRRVNKGRRERILDIMAEQEDDALKDMSPEKLRKMAKKLK